MRARSIIRRSARRSTRWAMPAGSPPNISRAGARRTVSPGWMRVRVEPPRDTSKSIARGVEVDRLTRREDRDMTEGSAEETEHARAPRLKDAMRQARIELAERSGVVVDLRDAELARLELLNQALDPVYAEIPEGAELFERGIAEGDTPRLWIDMIAHVAMGRDK